MNSIKTYLIVWLSGMVAALILIDRWRRMGDRSVPATADVGEVIATDTATMPMPVSADKQKLSTAIVTGARADVERGRQLLNKVAPWRSTAAPSPTEVEGNVGSPKE